MDISALDIYLVYMVDSLRGAFIITFALSALAFCILTVIVVDESSRGDDISYVMAKAWQPRSLFIAVVSAVLGLLTPDSKTLAAMYVVPALAKSELVSKDISDAGKAILRLATQWAEEKLTRSE